MDRVPNHFSTSSLLQQWYEGVNMRVGVQEMTKSKLFRELFTGNHYHLCWCRVKIDLRTEGGLWCVFSNLWLLVLRPISS